MFEMAGFVVERIARDYETQAAKEKHKTVGRREKFQQQYFKTRSNQTLLRVLRRHYRESVNAAYIGFKPYIVKTFS